MEGVNKYIEPDFDPMLIIAAVIIGMLIVMQLL